MGSELARVIANEGTFPPARAVVLDPSQDAKRGNLAEQACSLVADDVNQDNSAGSAHHRVDRLPNHRRPALEPEPPPRLVEGLDLGGGHAERQDLHIGGLAGRATLDRPEPDAPFWAWRSFQTR